MIKKLIVSFGLIIFLGLIIIKINPQFTYTGLLQQLKEFPNLLGSLDSVKLPDIPQIPVPDVQGIKQVVRGINALLNGITSLAEATLSLSSVAPRFVNALLKLIRFVFGV